MTSKSIGERIRAIAEEIERIDPNRAPVFTGFAQSVEGGQVYGMFQAGHIPGAAPSLAHAQGLLAEVRYLAASRHMGAGVDPS